MFNKWQSSVYLHFLAYFFVTTSCQSVELHETGSGNVYFAVFALRVHMSLVHSKQGGLQISYS